MTTTPRQCCKCPFIGPAFRSKTVNGVKEYTCIRCANREDAAKREKKPRTPIKKVSDKRAKQMREYSKIKIPEGVICEFPGCFNLATDKHHPAGRAGINLLDANLKFLCRACHDKITKDSGLGIALGLTEYRNRKAS